MPALDEALIQRLESSTAEMRSDSFWRDMASPVAGALRALNDEANAFDSVSAKEYRKNAVALFEAAEAQLRKASEMRLWVDAHEAVVEALSVLRGEQLTVAAEDSSDAAAAAAAAASAMKSSASVMTTAAPSGETAPKETQHKETSTAADVVDAAVEHAASNALSFDEEKARRTPLEWEQDDDGVVTVSIAVPSTCSKRDVHVVFSAERLRVTVRGHPLQPAVVDGDLLYAVRPSDCSWGLEGTGASRRLTINLEKVESQQRWVGLLADPDTSRKKELSQLISGVEGMGNLKPWNS